MNIIVGRSQCIPTGQESYITSFRNKNSNGVLEIRRKGQRLAIAGCKIDKTCLLIQEKNEDGGFQLDAEIKRKQLKKFSQGEL